MKYIIFLTIFLSSSSAFSKEHIFVIYDSTLSKVTAPNTSIEVTLFDVNEKEDIEEKINRELVYKGSATSIKEVEDWARKEFKSNPDLVDLNKRIKNAYAFTKPAMQFGITKVPAVIYSNKGKNYVVYGETNLVKALMQINHYVRSHD